MSDIVIEARDFTKRYGSTTAVNGVSFTVGRGEICGLLGPNGADMSRPLRPLADAKENYLIHFGFHSTANLRALAI